MNLKNKTYMLTKEFKNRQFWLPFKDAVGIVLELLEDSKKKTADWFKEWVKNFRKPKKNKKQEQLNLNFLQWIFQSKAEIAGNKEKR